MLHELIFVLSGFPSNVFLPYPPAPEKPCTFAIDSDFPNLHPAERESLNRLGQLGWYYSQLNEFCKNNNSNNQRLDNNNENKRSTIRAYAQALIASLHGTLSEYQQDILSMERHILNKDYDAGDGIIPTSLLTSSLGQWELLLPALVQFTQRLSERLAITNSKGSGLLLLDFVLDEARTGHNAYRRVMETMAARLYDVLYRQLTAWMVYGHIADEFFVSSAAATTSSASHTNMNNVGWQRYVLVKDRIPTRIPLALAESILFVGKAVATVKDPPETMKRENLQLLVALQHRQLTLDHVVQHMRKTTADWLFSKVLVGEHALGRYFTSFRNMFLLGYGDLTTNFIEACAQWRQRATLSKRSVSSAEKIFRHQEFNALLAKASVGTTATTTHDDQEEEDDGNDVDRLLDGYSVKILESRGGGSGFNDLLLIDVACTLRYDLKWPIDLFLSQSVMQQYSRLWSYLIGLKNVQMSLCESFLRTSQHAIWRLRSHMLYWVNALWSHVQANVIDVHYQHLIDIVSISNDDNDDGGDAADNNKKKTRKRQWTYNTLGGININSNGMKSLDFEELQNAHANYLQHVTRGCLLSSPECVKCIQGILRACLDFCGFIKQINEEWRGTKRRRMAKTASEIVREWTRGLEQESAMATAGDQVDVMEKEFIAMTDQFFDLLTNASQDIKVSGNVDMLLMQLDYNKWYSGDRSMRVL